ncbi:uncharacterized protein LOC128951652 [Oppia nitens]|uniref:uncharacterized protein LOC128951652 n=1 Tax=Oppia nitens TaxID=1686743 RepID=UPI0023DA4B7D|nr:uncharacterized protein LOC128951652 [Oppia nitens]
MSNNKSNSDSSMDSYGNNQGTNDANNNVPLNNNSTNNSVNLPYCEPSTSRINNPIDPYDIEVITISSDSEMDIENAEDEITPEYFLSTYSDYRHPTNLTTLRNNLYSELMAYECYDDFYDSNDADDENDTSNADNVIENATNEEDADVVDTGIADEIKPVLIGIRDNTEIKNEPQLNHQIGAVVNQTPATHYGQSTDDVFIGQNSEFNFSVPFGSTFDAYNRLRCSVSTFNTGYQKLFIGLNSGQIAAFNNGSLRPIYFKLQQKMNAPIKIIKSGVKINHLLAATDNTIAYYNELNGQQIYSHTYKVGKIISIFNECHRKFVIITKEKFTQIDELIFNDNILVNVRYATGIAGEAEGIAFDALSKHNTSKDGQSIFTLRAILLLKTDERKVIQLKVYEIEITGNVIKQKFKTPVVINGNIAAEHKMVVTTNYIILAELFNPDVPTTSRNIQIYRNDTLHKCFSCTLGAPIRDIVWSKNYLPLITELMQIDIMNLNDLQRTYLVSCERPIIKALITSNNNQATNESQLGILYLGTDSVLRHKNLKDFLITKETKIVKVNNRMMIAPPKDLGMIRISSTESKLSPYYYRALANYYNIEINDFVYHTSSDLDGICLRIGTGCVSSARIGPLWRNSGYELV